jgi:hypothetical protein
MKYNKFLSYDLQNAGTGLLIQHPEIWEDKKSSCFEIGVLVAMPE